MTDRNNDKEQAMARDLDACDLGMALTTGKLRRKYVKRREKIFAELKRMNQQDGLASLSDDELLKQLSE